MNHYSRHIGDYLKDTAHLSLLEHGVYGRLLDVYYTREGPIPDDQAARLIGARSREEKDALTAVLSEFFQRVDGEWRQKRADAELTAYLAGQPERETKKTNEALRLQRFRQERAALFARLHEHGLHADWNIKISDLRALVERTCNAKPETPATAPATFQVTPPATDETAPATLATATSTTTTTTTTTNIKTEREIARASPAGLACQAMRAAGIAAVNPSHPDLTDLLAAGVTPEQLGDLTREVFTTHGPKPMAYVLKVMRSRFIEPAPKAPASPPRRSVHDERAATIAAATGANRQRPVERDITPDSTVVG